MNYPVKVKAVLWQEIVQEWGKGQNLFVLCYFSTFLYLCSMNYRFHHVGSQEVDAMFSDVSKVLTVSREAEHLIMMMVGLHLWMRVLSFDCFTAVKMTHLVERSLNISFLGSSCACWHCVEDTGSTVLLQRWDFHRVYKFALHGYFCSLNKYLCVVSKLFTFTA